jgi:phosphoadenosine phosphosulfate reductase
MSRLKELEEKAILRLQTFAPREDQEPYYLAYSGGKDSDTILILAELAGVRYEAVHNLTTADAPETVYYVRSKPNVRIDKPELSMWQLIPKKLITPTQLIRYCCSELKERGGQGRRVVTGVRQAESIRRKKNSGLVQIMNKRKDIVKKAEKLGIEFVPNSKGGLVLNNDNDESRELVEDCYIQSKVLINPIYDWTDSDVWEFLRHYGCKSNPLYECGFKRIGCIGCPMGHKHRYFEFNRYPKYKENYIRAFERMLKTRAERGLKPQKSWKTGEEVFKWWMAEDINQLTFDDIFKLEGEK